MKFEKRDSSMKIGVLFIILSLSVLNLKAQTDTTRVNSSETQKSFLSRQIIPLSLIGVGSMLNVGSLKEDIYDITPKTQTQLDNYLQYAPIAELYGADALGIKHRNAIGVQTKYLLISEIVSGLLVHSLKSATKVERPRGGNTSFPSGHTTNAFVSATILYKEFKDTSPWVAYSGFAVATTTGILRMTNNAHWLPDVLAGAGIGILTVNLVYHFVANKRSPDRNKLCLVPKLYPKNYGVYFSYRF